MPEGAALLVRTTSIGADVEKPSLLIREPVTMMFSIVSAASASASS